MLELLKNVGLFGVAFFAETAGLILAFRFFMELFGYRWSAISVKRYLDKHGRGNLLEENRSVIAADMLTRALWVLVFAFTAGMLGFLFIPYTILRYSTNAAAVGFLVLMVWIELHFAIRIGRLVEVDSRSHIAFFEALDGFPDRNFDCSFEQKNRDFLCRGRKYMVVDYAIFKMFVAVDDYERGDA